ncbi:MULTISPECIES: hypothetical protein [unclassified Acinetobacter]|uniref:hypothetical protein n=1 Tax=unclassified Acinetobacter TaxID=196816 RepID=UPI0035BA8B65
MKLSKIFIMASILTVFTINTAQAKTTPIQFAKGSTCGYFVGDVAGRIFTLDLAKGQDLQINSESIEKIQVKQPNAKVIKPYYSFTEGNNPKKYWNWKIERNGKYSVTIHAKDDHSYINVGFCAM